MLVSREAEEKTYQELFVEALREIPVYSSEWTNFNASDPGITILENLIAFQMIQKNSMTVLPPTVQEKLLKILGFTKRKGRCARILLSSEQKTVQEISNFQQFEMGDLVFETNRSYQLMDYRIENIFGKVRGKYEEYPALLETELTPPVRIFGKNPMQNDGIYFVLNGLPEAGEEILFYFTVPEDRKRNRVSGRMQNRFASLRWECYTEEGFLPMNVRDYTACFMCSGEVRMRLPDVKALSCPECRDMGLEKEGYIIRAVLDYSDYDMEPRLSSVQGFLFEAWQKETQIACYTFQKTGGIIIDNSLMEEGYFMIFGKEEKGSSYHLYRPGGFPGEQGRFCEITQIEQGCFSIEFDKKSYGFAPEKLKNTVKVLVYSEELMRKYRLEKVLGYDNQRIVLPVTDLVPDTFCIVAERETEEGEKIYDFVKPDYHGEGDLSYKLLEKEGEIVIEDAGAFIGAQLYLGAVSITRGEVGNIRSCRHLKGRGRLEGELFYSPGPGMGGCRPEGIQELRRRFLQDLERPYTAVTISDYERIVLETPQLCIHKVKAFLNRDENIVYITVKPNTGEAFPALSETYKGILAEELEKRRILTTRVKITPPQYLGIDVRAVIYVKYRPETGKEKIEKLLREKLDHVSGDGNFGDIVYYDELFYAIEKLDFVEYVYDLSVYPEDRKMGKVRDKNIVPEFNCLCYPRNISLEIRMEEGRKHG